MRSLGISRRGPHAKLLHMVGGKPHAGAEDHEETAYNSTHVVPAMAMNEEDTTRSPESSSDEQQPAPTTLAVGMDEDFSKSPVSSDDERVPSPKHARSPKPNVEKKPARVTQMIEEPPRRSRKQPTKKLQAKKFHPPQPGSFTAGLEDKERSTSATREETGGSKKGNKGQDSHGSVGKRSAEEVGRLFSPFGFEHRPVKRPLIEPTPNLHARPPGASRTAYASQRNYGSGPSKGVSDTASGLVSKTTTAKNRKKPKTYTTKKPEPTPDPGDDPESEDSETLDLNPKTKSHAQKKVKEDHGSDSEVSCVTLNITAAKSPKGKSRNAKDAKVGKSNQASSPAKPARPKLLETLSSYGLNPLSSGTPNTELSSLRSFISNAPQESLQHLEKYLADQQDLELSSQQSRCPLCHEPISESYLADFEMAHPQMTPRDQRRFCHEHKKQRAMEQYTEKRYPNIDWENFTDRIQKHFPRLEAVLTDTTLDPSHYRQVHADKVSEGKERTALSLAASDKILESTTGYYGTRGARAMMEAITTHFSDLIRECMINDQVVSFGGIGNFVQRVLVPELSCCLVMEDFGCGDEQARAIVEESGECGAFVNEEVMDRVVVVEESEDEGD
ncbi:uncharacterized protein BDR25DRAFT_265682 [Lindgomyces ingoldianus]|uniref:Uncharacterized protein n=1 Tax=Lindgomyces ingoldianus TaxID=673940 RepID=A0ACB6QM57_9PLEO|nr:uncharacterized protein BDR25DRAFT_265682 [Lindgomyces ingoldianus]KAF2468094.1 hypothetical protein BDR25DRAFT_265682 [Lindgomyces ingoldianus]